MGGWYQKLDLFRGLVTYRQGRGFTEHACFGVGMASAMETCSAVAMTELAINGPQKGWTWIGLPGQEELSKMAVPWGPPEKLAT